MSELAQIQKAIEDAQTNKSGIDNLAESNVGLLRKKWMTGESLADFRHWCRGNIVDEDDAMWIAHGNRRNAELAFQGGQDKSAVLARERCRDAEGHLLRGHPRASHIHFNCISSQVRRVAMQTSGFYASGICLQDKSAF